MFNVNSNFINSVSLSKKQPTATKNQTGIQPFQGISGKTAHQDTITFSGSEPKENPAIQQEYEKLRDKLPALSKTMELETLKPRAEYNVTQNRDVLNVYLPYRDQLKKENKTEDLKKYDQLVDKIMEKAEFYHAENGQTITRKILDLYPKRFPYIPVLTPIYRAIKKYIATRLFIISRSLLKFHVRKLTERQKIKGPKVSDEKFQDMLKQNTKPLKDKSSQYLVAAGIAELMHKHPEAVDTVLNPPDKRPLRFILTEKGYGGLAGQTMIGTNAIWLCQPMSWGFAKNQKKHLNISQHEFIHALSQGSDMDVLPIMGEKQKKEFRAIRDEMERHYLKHDHSFMNIFRPSNKTSSGLLNYAFKDNIEFLASSIDTFKMSPDELCKTESGRKLYHFYEGLFGIDPLHDFPEKKAPDPTPTGATETPVAKAPEKSKVI